MTPTTSVRPRTKCARTIRYFMIACALLGSARIATAQPQVLPETRVPGARPDQPQPLQPEPAPELPGEISPPPAISIQDSRSAPVSNAIGSAPSASEGRINQLDLADRPFLRPTDILELVPGLQVGNHAGTIKAAEYLLRGFYLDNGTDISVWIDDVPYNMPNNPHLHGYLDLNMMIPELVQYIDFQKGPYYAENGDFSLAARMHISMVDSLPCGIIKTEAGKNSYFRELVANSGCVGQGTLLYAAEAKYYNGPWEYPNDARQFNGILRYTMGDDCDGLRVTAWAYSGVGRTEDPISDLAVQAGVLNRFGTFDPFLGLSTQRHQINTQWWHKDDAGDLTKANLYYIYYRFNIFANTTGDLQDPVNGDTVQQFMHSSIFGGNVSQSFTSRLFGDCVRDTFGLQSRNDNIPHLGVNHVLARNLLNVIDDASVKESSLGLYWTNEVKWGPKVRTVLGVRCDYFHWHVDDFALGDPNSGKTESKLFEPKGSLILGPWCATEFYVNGGYGFHSNAAGGIFANLSSDFITGPAGAIPNPNGLATPLARGRGAEVGMKTQIIPHLTTTAALWYLRLQSELIFDPVGDTGVPRGASERYGVEISNTYRLNGWLTVDADWSASQAHFLEPDPDDGGTKVDQAVGVLASIGPTVRWPPGYFASMRYKYVGPRNLLPDGSISSTAINVFSLSSGYEDQRMGYGVELYNLFNNNGHDAAFAVDTAVNGVAFLGGTTSHPLEPFQARFYFTLHY
jgi:hypothetical protein